MVTTGRATDRDDLDHNGPPPQRRVQRLSRLPGSRAIVGGLLVAMAGIGTLVAWQRASGTPDHAYAVARRPILPGETVTADLVRLAPIDLPDGVSDAAFDDDDAVAGRVALALIGEGELIQASQLSEPGEGVSVAEVSFALERDRAVDGRLRSGDLVDVFVTHDDRTEAVVEGVRVVEVSDSGATTFTAGSQITVTVALADADRRADVIHAVRSAEVTLVRSTHLSDPGPAPSAPAPGSPPPAAPPAGGDAPDGGDGESEGGG